MAISISSMAWRPTDLTAAIKIISRYGFEKIDLTPWEYREIMKFGDLSKLLADYGLSVQALQGITFGWGVNVFSSRKYRNDAFLECIKANVELASQLGSSNLIFGSPTSRNYLEFYSKSDAIKICIEEFTKVAEICETYSVKFCLEPVSEIFGEVIFNDFRTTEQVIRSVDSDYFGLNLDTGFILSKSDKNFKLDEISDLVEYGHISSDGAKSFSDQPIPFPDHNVFELTDFWALEMNRSGGLQALISACTFLKRYV